MDRDYILNRLGIQDAVRVVDSVDRPNLRLAVDVFSTKADAKAAVQEVVRSNANTASIVYCQTKRDCDSMSKMLNKAGVLAKPYHSKVTDKLQKEVYKDWKTGNLLWVCTTSAFEMGIDKPNVRLVLHLGLTFCTTAFPQQTGRAGRDGLPALAKTFRFDGDKAVIKGMTSRELWGRVVVFLNTKLFSNKMIRISNTSYLEFE